MVQPQVADDEVEFKKLGMARVDSGSESDASQKEGNAKQANGPAKELATFIQHRSTIKSWHHSDTSITFMAHLDAWILIY